MGVMEKGLKMSQYLYPYSIVRDVYKGLWILTDKETGQVVLKCRHIEKATKFMETQERKKNVSFRAKNR